jgi:hypothetical protein
MVHEWGQVCYEVQGRAIWRMIAEEVLGWVEQLHLKLKN